MRLLVRGVDPEEGGDERRPNDERNGLDAEPGEARNAVA